MKHHAAQGAFLSFALAAAALASSGGALAVDDEAAKALMKKSDCTKCHAADKDKLGPAYKKIATQYKGKADAEQKLIKFISTTSKVKLAGGAEQEHKAITTQDAKEIKNVVQWVLAQ